MLLPAGTLSHKEKSAGSCGKSQRWHGLIYHHLGAERGSGELGRSVASEP